MCLTVLPPKPEPRALVGLWFCGKQGFEASQAFEAVAAENNDQGKNYQIQLKTTGGQVLCVSQAGSC
jgi:hypothetical protein